MVFITGNTESNVITMYKNITAGTKSERELYHKFWTRVLTKGMTMTVIANLILAYFDDEDFFERYRIAWKEGG